MISIYLFVSYCGHEVVFFIYIFKFMYYNHIDIIEKTIVVIFDFFFKVKEYD